ncbi:MAG: Nif3-like dinuclear metal center hexameric protein [Acidobacteriota bacterium]
MTAVDRDRLVAELHQYLEADQGRDYGPNGLQVQGAREIRKVVTGVSASRELFERAADAGAQAVLVHHGLFWDGMPSQLTGVMHGRVAALMRADLNLIAYHLPLDRHGEVGNNVLAAQALGLAELEPFAVNLGFPIGYRGRFTAPLPFSELLARCAQLFGQQPLAQGSGPEQISTVGIVSGGAQKDIYQAIAAGLDVFITGEISEWVMNLAREAGIHYLSVGHHASEVLGIKALGEWVAERFGIEVEYIDVPNPV